MLEWCLDNRVTHIQAVTHTLTLPPFLELNPETIALVFSNSYGEGPRVRIGRECIAWRWAVTQELITNIHRYSDPGVRSMVFMQNEVAI